ncbi:MAG: PTS transporter subunit EIIC [Erysipelotrichaceae bacterium]|nr:PTS transporter subunit EIIC [Erysipelotrichaceae bacterium]
MANEKKDFGALAASIVELIGGKDNIAHAAHCLTRLRITPKDTSLVKIDDIKKLGVIGAQMIGDQVQVIIGNDIEEVYDAFVNVSGVERVAAIDENLDPELTKKKKSFKEILGSIFPAIVACVFPILPALLACGMLQSIVMIATNIFKVPADNPTITTLTWIYNVAFWFLPVFVGYAAAKRFGVKAAMGILMGAILIHPTFLEAVKAGAGYTVPNPGGPPTVVPGTGSAGSLFGFNIYPGDYTSTIIPVIVCVFVQSFVEKFLNKIVPKNIRFVLVPTLEILIMAPLGLLVLAPISHRLSSAFAGLLISLFHIPGAGPVLICLFAAFYPFIVITGMHFNLMAVAMAIGQQFGKNPLTSVAGFLFQYTQAAACLAVALKAKDAERRSLALSCAFSDAVPGISEPGMYGITFKYKKSLYAAMIGSAVGGLIAAILNVGSYAGGPPNLFTWAMFINPAPVPDAMGDLKRMIICTVIGAIVTFVLTLLFYKDEEADQIDAQG